MFFVLFAGGIACQRGGSCLHAVTGNIKGLFCRQSDGMGGHGNRAQTGGDGSENYLAKGEQYPFACNGHANTHTLPHNVPVITNPAERQAQLRAAPCCNGHQCAAQNQRKGRSNTGTCHAPTGAPYGEVVTESRRGAGRRDQQEVENDVHNIHQCTDEHRCFGVSGGTDGSTHDDACRTEQHGCANDGKIDRRIFANLLCTAQPAGKEGADCQRDSHNSKAQHQHQQHSLCRRRLCSTGILCTQCHGNAGGHAHTGCVHGIKGHPGDRCS